MVRHGETVWHAENRYAGSSDVDLTEHGRAQARRLARWAATANLAACYSSTLTRARDTAAAVAKATGLAVHEDPRLSEVDFGRGEGKTSEEMRTLFGEEYAAFLRDPATHHLPGGEDPAVAVSRGLHALEDITTTFASDRVLVVWHGTLMRLVLCRLLGVSLSEYRRVFPVVRNTARTEIRLRDGQFALLEFNGPIES